MNVVPDETFGQVRDSSALNEPHGTYETESCIFKRA